MRRKIHDLREWTGALSWGQTQRPFRGFRVVDFAAYRVPAPRSVALGGAEVSLTDHGQRWVRMHPQRASQDQVGEALTAALDANGRPISLYLDLHAGGGIDAGSGLPYIHDLYLDLVAALDTDWQCHHLTVLDADELAQAVAAGGVSEALAACALDRLNVVQAELRAGGYAPLQAARAYVSRFLYPPAPVALPQPVS